jgi:pectin methylesterase-like acyl-CoA thioesterase
MPIKDIMKIIESVPYEARLNYIKIKDEDGDEIVYSVNSLTAEVGTDEDGKVCITLNVDCEAEQPQNTRYNASNICSRSLKENIRETISGLNINLQNY